MAEEKKGQFPSSLKEARQHGSFSFPCAFYQAVPETNPPGFPFTVKHHWHEPVEIIYLEQDSYQVDINMTLTHLKSPCFCFINSGELHALTSDSEQYQEQAVVFSPDLLTFAAPDPAQEQFLLPLSEHKLSFPSFLGSEHPAFSEVQQEFFRIRSIFSRENRNCLDQFTIERTEHATIGGTPEVQKLLEEKGSTLLKSGTTIAELIRRPELNYEDLAPIDKERPFLPWDVKEQVEINLKYEGYIKRQMKQVEQFKKLEAKKIPEDLDYEKVGSLRIEARQKLEEYRPVSIGQASRISGVSPADISVLLVYLEQYRRNV